MGLSLAAFQKLDIIKTGLPSSIFPTLETEARKRDLDPRRPLR